MWCLKVNENKITIDNDFNRNFLEDGDKTQSDNDPKIFLQFFLKILDVFFNFETVKDIRRGYFNRNFRLAIFEPPSTVFARWE